MSRNYADRMKVVTAQGINAKEQLFKNQIAQKLGIQTPATWLEIVKTAEKRNFNLLQILKELKAKRKPLKKEEFFYLDAIKIVKELKAGAKTCHQEVLMIESVKCGDLEINFFTIQDKYLYRLGEFAKIEISNKKVNIFKFVA
ncbi:MAG: hypothetical protein R3Y43_00535 [Alphaproteobacteria bacterium]